MTLLSLSIAFPQPAVPFPERSPTVLYLAWLGRWWGGGVSRHSAEAGTESRQETEFWNNLVISFSFWIQGGPVCAPCVHSEPFLSLFRESTAAWTPSCWSMAAADWMVAVFTWSFVHCLSLSQSYCYHPYQQVVWNLYWNIMEGNIFDGHHQAQFQ